MHEFFEFHTCIFKPFFAIDWLISLHLHPPSSILHPRCVFSEMGPKKAKTKGSKKGEPTERPNTRSKSALLKQQSQDSKDEAEMSHNQPSLPILCANVVRKARSGWTPSTLCGSRVPVRQVLIGRSKESEIEPKKIFVGESSKPMRRLELEVDSEDSEWVPEVEEQEEDSEETVWDLAAEHERGKGKGKKGNQVGGPLPGKGKGEAKRGDEGEDLLPKVRGKKVREKIDVAALATLPYVSGLESCLNELRKIRETREKITSTLVSLLSSSGAASPTVLAAKLSEFQAELLDLNRLEQVLVESVSEFTSFILNSERVVLTSMIVYTHLKEHMERKTVILAPSESPIRDQLKEAAALDGFTFFSYSYA